MAESYKTELTKSKLDIEGVQVSFIVRVGDWTRRVDISPIDYKVFKKWDKIYAERVVKSIVENIEHELTKGDN